MIFWRFSLKVPFDIKYQKALTKLISIIAIYLHVEVMVARTLKYVDLKTFSNIQAKLEEWCVARIS